jgi:hypothetical protein
MIVGYVLQGIGIATLLYFNSLFIQRSRKKYGNLKKAFVDIAAARLMMNDKELEKANADAALRTFPLAQFLYRTYRNSLIAVAITMIGLVLSVMGKIPAY